MAKKHSDYRKFYADFFGISWDRKKYQIHHIDGDRTNNKISNLILLPTELHKELHAVFSSVPINDELTIKEATLAMASDVMNGWSNWDLNYALPQRIAVLRKCIPYGMFKNVMYSDGCGGMMEEFKRDE